MISRIFLESLEEGNQSCERRVESREECFESRKLTFWHSNFKKRNAYYRGSGRIFDLKLAILKKDTPSPWRPQLQVTMTSPLPN